MKTYKDFVNENFYDNIDEEDMDEGMFGRVMTGLEKLKSRAANVGSKIIKKGMAARKVTTKLKRAKSMKKRVSMALKSVGKAVKAGRVKLVKTVTGGGTSVAKKSQKTAKGMTKAKRP